MDRPSTLAELLDYAAQQAPASGIFDNDGSFLSWTEVLAQTTALASTLARAGVGAGDRVAVHHPRSAASFVGVHAALRLGAVMVPLDPFGPPEGIQTVVEAVTPAALICSDTTLARHDLVALTESSTVVVCAGNAHALLEAGFAPERLLDLAHARSTPEMYEPAAVVQPDDPAYIIFTSGSTGIPKGIVHTHASGVAYAEMGAAAHGIVPTDRLAAISPLHFDQSTLDLYAIPFAGASVVMVTEAELRFPASLSKRIETTSTSMIYTTPYQLQQLVARGDLGSRNLTALRQVAFGGEAFSPENLVDLGQRFPGAELLNVYGPAEVNGVTVHSFGVAPQSLESVPIGRPCTGVGIRLVDEKDHLVDAGESGEILVESATMMTGYWRRPDLNEQCFVELEGVRYYRTGDHGHIDADGLLQFEGRLDNLVKVRGVRIELEAIERVLEDAPGVLHAVAVLVDTSDGDVQQIVAWIVPAGDTHDAVATMNWCRERLPANAVPTAFHLMATVPTTATGKIDRASLRDALASVNDAAHEPEDPDGIVRPHQ